MNTSTSTTKAWKDWFNAQESATTINKIAQERLFKIFDSSISVDRCKNEIEGHTETAFLFRQNFGQNRIGIFHHMKSVGGNIYVEKEDFGFILGIEELATCIMTPDHEILLGLPQDHPEPTPTTSHLLSVSSVEEVDALAIGQTTTYKPRNFIPIPPFLLNTISKSISNSEGNSKQVLIKVVQEIKNFDTTHAGDEDYVDKARSKCKDLLAWLYLVGTNVVTAVPTLGCNSRPIIDHFKKIEEDHLARRSTETNSIQSTRNFDEVLKRPLEILASSASSTQDFMYKLTQIQSQNSDKSSKSFKKIAPKYQKMLLNASSQGAVMPLELNSVAMEFFSQSSVLNAQIFLNSHLEALKIECSVSTALTNSLMHGSFLWANSLTPSGLASSVITSSDIIRQDTLQEGIVLDYSTKYEMSSQSLQKLTKTQVLFPTSVEASIERIRALHALVELFFDQGSLLQQGLKKFINSCLDNKNLFRTKQFLDDMFIPKLHFMLDDRLNKWLSQCCRVDDVTDTNLDLIKFSSIFNDIQMNRFFCDLPPSINKLHKKSSFEFEVGDDKSDSPRKKKTKKSSAEQIKNIAQDRTWKLRVDESWDTIFKNKSRDGPVLSFGSKPCLKYHSKGVCYSDCPFSSSHKQLKTEDKTKTSNFIKELRGE